MDKTSIQILLKFNFQSFVYIRKLALTSRLSALVIVKPLPTKTHLLRGEDLDLFVTVYASIASEDDLTLSLGHSLRGLYEDITKHLVYKISEERDMVNTKDDGKMWNIDITLSYNFSDDLGHLILSIGDNHSGAITSTRLVIGEGIKPFFDPIPEDVMSGPGLDVLIKTQVRGSTPIMVNYLLTFI